MLVPARLRPYSSGVRRLGVAVAVLLVGAVGAMASRSGDSSPKVVIGSTSTTQAAAPDGPSVPPAPPAPVEAVPAPAPATPPAAGPLKVSDGRAYGNAIPFNSSIPVPSELTFVLVVGSDARPGQDIRRTNADSIHLLAVNPATREGTVVGFPRDSYVEIPGRGRGKINSALAQGGPGLMVDTVRKLTGLPIQYYALTGFEGLASMVDALGGVDVLVGRRMDDRMSGARFEQGWHRFNGAQALAFTRNRYDVQNGDFSRSENQGTLVLAALGKMRSEVGDDGGLRRWMDVLLRHASLDVAPDRLIRLAALGRNLDPGRIRNVVAPGRIGFAGRQSVVYLDAGATNLFNDLRDDAVIGGTSSAPPPAPAGQPAPTAPPTTAAPGLLAPTTTVPPDPADPPPTSPPATIVPPITLFQRD